MSDHPKVQHHISHLQRFGQAFPTFARWTAVKRGTAWIFKRLRADSARRRRILLYTIAVAVGVTTVATMILTILALTSSANTADRLAAAGDVLVGATLMLAVIAALVALLAYAVSTGFPDLRLQFAQTGQGINEIIFTDAPVNGRESTIAAVVENKSSYAARTPAVVVEFRDAGILIKEHAATAGWTATARARGVYIMALQWDGGPNYSIHGNSFRYLPDLNLQGLRPFSDYPSEIVFRLLADGYNRPDIVVPIIWVRDIESRLRETPPEWF